MSRNIEFAPNEFYHLYNRGTEKRDIFSSDADRERFMALLYLSNAKEPVHIDLSKKLQGHTLHGLLETKRAQPLVDIVAYCLMPNHFHLLVHETDTGHISRFMQKLLTGYTMYFNKKYERSGALFQGKFKATHAEDDNYLKYLISYMHLNPVKLIEPNWKTFGIQNKGAAKKFLSGYRFSSYSDFRGVERIEKNILNCAALPDYFSTTRDFDNEVSDWLEFTEFQDS